MQCRPIMRVRTSCLSTPAAFSIRPRKRALKRLARRLAENGRVIVTGCLGNEAEMIRARYPKVLAISGAHQYEAVVGAVHEAAPMPVNAFINLVPEGALETDAPPLFLSEDFRRLQPSLRLLHYPQHSWRSRQQPDRRGTARGRETGGCRNQGTAGHFAGYVGLRRRHAPRTADMERPRGPRAYDRSGARTGRACAHRMARHLGCGCIMSIPIRMSIMSSR